VLPTTRHTLLRRASSVPEALDYLLRLYWTPLHRYVMLRFRRNREEAEDLVQGFCSAVLEESILARYEPGRGPFRPYLRSCLDHFVLKSLGRERLPGGTIPEELPGGDTPEQVFEREWRRRIFELAIDDLRTECETTGRAVRFDVFAAYDLADRDRPSYEDLAQKHGIAVTTVTNHLAWARRELRRLVRERL